MRVLENRMMSRIFGPIWQKVRENIENFKNLSVKI
jgi:hypothetical protein